MKSNPLIIICIVCAVVAVILLSMVAVQQPFPVFNATTNNSSIVDVTQDIGGADSRFFWKNTGLALIAQAFVLFAAAAATLGLLKIKEEKQHA